MLPVPPAVSPLAAAELLTLRVALSGSGAVRERELRATPPVLPPEPHPVLDPLLVRPVVHTVGAVAVLRPGATVAPVRAAVVLTNVSLVITSSVITFLTSLAPSHSLG